MGDLIVSCHLCLAQVEVTQTRIVMATTSGRLIPVKVERIRRQQGVSPQRWVRLCPTCNKQREEE